MFIFPICSPKVNSGLDQLYSGWHPGLQDKLHFFQSRRGSSWEPGPWPRDLTQQRMGLMTCEPLPSDCGSHHSLAYAKGPQSFFSETILALPAQAPRMLANIVILLFGALGYIFSYSIFLTDVFSSTGATKLVICITSLFIIYSKTQISRALYDCYLIRLASWSKGPAISLSCHNLEVGGFQNFVLGQPIPPATIPTAKHAYIR